jgi:hypothetical protein
MGDTLFLMPSSMKLELMQEIDANFFSTPNISAFCFSVKQKLFIATFVVSRYGRFRSEIYRFMKSVLWKGMSDSGSSWRYSFCASSRRAFRTPSSL